MLETYLIEIDCPPGADHLWLKEYIEAAIQGWCGGLDPADPMFDLDRDSIKIRHVSVD